jgi:ABC-type nickel/cobalt efflux system permease component RcnA
MGAGTGIAVAALVAVAGLVRKPQIRAAERGRRWAQRLDGALRVLGGLAILSLGTLLFWATVTAPPAPFAG